ncbi:MAG: hypothetical protein M1831_002492 [Alyxoria varia]|nr:MAG: hypothetical protein M1831_002492 [Alyxoria varia]
MPPLPKANTVGAACIGLTAVGYTFYRMEDFKTPGIRNIEKRHSAAGGADTHTPAGGTKMGDENSMQGKQETEKGMSSKHFQENFGSQGPEPSAVAKKWNKTHYGGENGKTGYPKN